MILKPRLPRLCLATHLTLTKIALYACLKSDLGICLHVTKSHVLAHKKLSNWPNTFLGKINKPERLYSQPVTPA